MNKGIVITTHKSTDKFLYDLLDSLKFCEYPIIVKKNTDTYNGWEISGIKLGSEIFKEFIYLHDTTYIKDISIIDELFNKYEGYSASLINLCYFGKYESKIIKEMEIPEIETKLEAARLEKKFVMEYVARCKGLHEVLYPELDSYCKPTVFRERHGRNNAIYETDKFIKYKGTWTEDMIK